MRQFPFLAAMVLALSLGGCLNSTTVINVKPDGSGTIEQTMTMNPQAAAQLQQMASGFGQGGAEKKGGVFNEQDLRAAAPKMGQGVTFVSATPIHTAAAEGTTAIYAFTDITKLQMNQKPAAPGGASAMGGMPGGSGAEDMLFRFAKTPAGTSKVTVVFPEAQIDEARKTRAAAQTQAAKANDPMQAAALAMARQMMNGLKISIVMQPTGRILKTNSPYVEGQRVTLLEMDFGQLMGDEAMLQKLQAAGSLEEMKPLLKGVKGVKINTDKEVSVEFAGR
jgi:hypothetical protein